MEGTQEEYGKAPKDDGNQKRAKNEQFYGKLHQLITLGFSRREAELVVRYREMIGGYRSMEETSLHLPQVEHKSSMELYLFKPKSCGEITSPMGPGYVLR